MRALVLGGDGMLGHKVHQTLTRRLETWVTFRGPVAEAARLPVYADIPAERLVGGVDAFNFDVLTRTLSRVRPNVVVNCIGVVKQRREADDPLVSLTVNSLLPHRLADLCGAAGARLIHVSTDCVFSGQKGCYIESDPPDPTDLYGRTKLLGELDRPGCLTLRTSIVGRDFRNQTGLLEWFLGQRGQTIKGYRRMIFSGLPTRSFAIIIDSVIEQHPDLEGLYHVASEPISKLHLLTKIRDALKLDIDIEATDGPACDRSLDPSRFVAATGHRVLSWDELIGDLVTDRTPYDDWRTWHATA